ncbi:hypothetical protein PR202_ga15157 [Eleusine coracana subsp. coracana]|uniref:Uncharacterized protein n=1 Tax=Eleusine coracana subsp. coracana TaxID=191504 RepID=A0AAV5CJA6_ELECO|nr:hypothetical protein PR202_ga15157 [Eleusine coracana subsp. coracana]
MGGAVSGSVAAGDAEGASYPVMLNVYDLTPLNNYLHWCGLGIFHSAVEGERPHDFNSNGLIGSTRVGCHRAFCNCLLPEGMRLESTETKHLARTVVFQVDTNSSNTTSNENLEDDLEDKHLLPTSSVAEDAIVKEIHR